MGPDLSVFDRIKTKADFDREAELFDLKKQALTQAKSGNLPAALQIADRITQLRQAQAMGTDPTAEQQIQDIQQAQKIMRFDPGIYMNDGIAQTFPGYERAAGQIAGAKAGASQNAQNQSDYQWKPQIAQATESAKGRAGTQSELNERVASLPQLEETVARLSELGRVATYTTTGRVYDAARRELGLDPRAEAVARKEYLSLVDNQILPLLRQTFGAQFTQKEGESLKATLGDPNATPEEKDAVLRSFIDQKKATIETMQRQMGQNIYQDAPIENQNFGDLPFPDVAGGEQFNTVPLSEADLNAMGVPQPAPMPTSPYQREEALFSARAAIRKGADPEAVRQRLIENGIDPGGL